MGVSEYRVTGRLSVELEAQPLSAEDIQRRMK